MWAGASMRRRPGQKCRQIGVRGSLAQLCLWYSGTALYCTVCALHMRMWVRVCACMVLLELVATLSPNQGRPESPSPLKVARRYRWAQASEGRRVAKRAKLYVGQPSVCWVQSGELHVGCICGTGRHAEGVGPPGLSRHAAVAVGLALLVCPRWTASRQQPPEGVMRAQRVPW